MAALTADTIMMCPRGGNVAVSAEDSSALAAADGFFVSGCPYAKGLNPSPCVQVSWVGSDNEPLTTSSMGYCYGADGASQGRS